jgi:putative nucleotidyltransferase with HDIG domain
MSKLTATEQIDAARSAEAAGAWDEALAGYTAALHEARSNGYRAIEAELLRTIGRVYADRGEYDRARESFEACLVIAQGAGERALCAAALNALAAVAQLRGEFDVAESLYARASVLADELGDERMCALVDQNLGTIANTRGDLRTALLRYESALARFRSLGDHRATALALNNMGMLQTDAGEWAAAELSLDAAFLLAERHSDWGNQGRIELNRAELFLKKQSYDRAATHVERALRIFTKLASHSGLADVHRVFGALYVETGKPQVARMQLALALRLARSCENRLSEAETERERARLFLAERQFRTALLSLNRAYAIFCDIDARREIIDVRRRLERLEQPYFEALQLWTMKEPALHEERSTRAAHVGDLATRLMRQLGLDSELTTVRIAAFLHDIGMAALPRDVVGKPGPLSADEWKILEQHPVIGEQILRELRFSAELCATVRHHHERWNGGGYPDGLAGERIPMLARVICLTGAYAALTSPRPFRVALSSDQALALMAMDAGRVFDPRLVALFHQVVHETQHGQRVHVTTVK